MTFRVIAFVLFTSALAISGYHRKRAERDGSTIARTDEGLTAMASRIVVAIPLFLAILLFVFWPSSIAWAEVSIPAWLRWIAAAVGVLAVAAAAWTLRSLGSNISPTVLTKRDQRLITRGPYRWVRHPLYASGIVLLVSIGIMARSAFILGWTLVAVGALLAVVIPREERHLVDRFGSAYDEYRRETSALLPFKGGVDSP